MWTSPRAHSVPPTPMRSQLRMPSEQSRRRGASASIPSSRSAKTRMARLCGRQWRRPRRDDAQIPRGRQPANKQVHARSSRCIRPQISVLLGERNGQAEVSEPIFGAVGYKVVPVNVQKDLQEAKRIVETTGDGQRLRGERRPPVPVRSPVRQFSTQHFTLTATSWLALIGSGRTGRDLGVLSVVDGDRHDARGHDD